MVFWHKVYAAVSKDKKWLTNWQRQSLRLIIACLHSSLTDVIAVTRQGSE